MTLNVDFLFLKFSLNVKTSLEEAEYQIFFKNSRYVKNCKAIYFLKIFSPFSVFFQEFLPVL